MAEQDQDQIAGIRSDARQHSQGDEYPGGRFARRDLHNLLDQGGHQACLLGQTDADYDQEDDADRAEIDKVPHHRGQHEADAVAAQ
jgi:hypothetical protein